MLKRAFRCHERETREREREKNRGWAGVVERRQDGKTGGK
jgi:hypothetical protein